MSFPERIYETKIGTYQGRMPRVSFEKTRLKDTGFLPGSFIHVEIGKDKVTISLDKDGERQVTSRNGEPVIDLKMEALIDAFGQASIVKAIVGEREITLSLMKEEKERRRARNKIKQKKTFRVLDVFGSIGTLAKSLLDTGHYTIDGVVDINERALNTYRKNHPNATIWCGDVANVEWERFKDADVMLMTPSCRPFSIARTSAKKNKEEAPEGDNTIFCLLAVSVVRPFCLILEEVLPFAQSYSFMVLKSFLVASGYEISETILDAQDYGALSTRKRFCMVASMKKGFTFDAPQRPLLTLSVEDILETPIDDREFPDLQRFVEYGNVQSKKGNNFQMKKVFPHSTRVQHPTTKYYGRQSEAFLTHPDNENLIDRFSPRELARIAQLPDDFILPDTKSAAAAGIGDGIVYGKFFHVGQQLYKHLTEKGK